ncbi:MAG: hypothetical protein K6T77_04300 [candidate division WOR-3 bacterium]|jgi:hypothetical protein|nr:hypothetical protein [candidate division WOR-3 bacterium]MCR4423924.1 hypothetical protein [candidate division WOR-3 bacterium]MDH7519262.1 hypothetical protein [bacterium]
MELRSPEELRPFVEIDRTQVVDERAKGGEVILIPLLNPFAPLPALGAVADNLAWFMEQVTGRGYQKAEEVYELGYVVREPGHQAFGLKVNAEGGMVVISRIAILEDESIFRRYADYLRTGLLF